MKRVLNQKFTAPLEPPAKKARFPTVVAAKSARACDKEAVIHVFEEE
jgi:hypothetical protein